MVLMTSLIAYIILCRASVFDRVPSGVTSEYVNSYIPIQARLKWSFAITRLTVHCVSGLMSGLVICKFRKSMVIHDTEYPCNVETRNH